MIAWWIGIISTYIFWLSAAIAGQEGSRLETLDQYTRLQIPITSGTTFRILSGKSGEVTLMLDRVAAGALEALAKLTDSRVREVRVKAVGLDKAEITVFFLDAATESFAYQQENKLILDLWHGAPVKANLAKPVDATLPASVKRVAGKVKNPGKGPHGQANAERKLPAVAAVEPLRIGHEIFQKFLLPMPELVVIAKDGGIDLPPKFDLESRWKFSEGDKQTEEGSAFEFAKRLFAAKKYGLSLKTIEIMLRDHPESPNAGELNFLRALAYKKMGEATKADFLKERSEKMLEELAARRDKSGQPLPFERLIVLYFAQKELQAQNWLQAIQHLENVVAGTKPNDPDFPYVQMLLAETYSKLNQPRRAERLYRFLTEKFPDHTLAKEAYYRIADLLALEKNYFRVIDEGEAAIQAYPAYEKSRPEVLFHIGEACFWLGQYAKAEKYLRRFTEKASAQTSASLAWVRLGEIEEVHHGNIAAAREDYLRAKNGYPFSRGDLVATVRLARIDLPNEMQPGFVVRNLKELLQDKTVEWELRRMAELTLADYLIITGEVEESIEIASTGMAHTDGIVYGLYERAYEKGLFHHLSQLTHDKKYSLALALYGRERKWLEQYGPDTFLIVSEIYRALGLYSSANKLMARYSTELARQARSPASVSGVIQFASSKAANSFASGAYAEALRELADRQDALSSYMRAISHFHLGHKREAYGAAEHALPLVKAARANFTDAMIENLSEVLIDWDNSEHDFRHMETDVAAASALCAKDNELLFFAAADALWYQKRHREAAEAYKTALEKFPSGIRSDRGRYNLGMSLVALGKHNDAVKLLTELRNSGQNVWSESARQELELIEWERKYSSVLRTLPPSGLGIAN